MSLIGFSGAANAQQQVTDTNVASDKKILVAYFSCTGTTEKVADAIAEATGGKLYRITPAKAYTSADLDWNNKKSGKTVIPFATSGGSSITGSVKQLKKLYPKIVWKEGRLLNGGIKQAGEWAKQASK